MQRKPAVLVWWWFLSCFCVHTYILTHASILITHTRTHTHAHTHTHTTYTHTHTHTHTHTLHPNNTLAFNSNRHTCSAPAIYIYIYIYALIYSSVPRHHKSCQELVLASGKTESFSAGSWVCRPAVCVSRTAGFMQTLTVTFNHTPVTKYWNRPDHRLSGLCPKDTFSASFRCCLMSSDVG